MCVAVHGLGLYIECEGADLIVCHIDPGHQNGCARLYTTLIVFTIIIHSFEHSFTYTIPSRSVLVWEVDYIH